MKTSLFKEEPGETEKNLNTLNITILRLRMGKGNKNVKTEPKNKLQKSHVTRKKNCRVC